MTEFNFIDLLLALVTLGIFSLILSVISLNWGKFMTMLEPKKVIKNKGIDICPFCKKELKDEWNYCPNCGQMLSWEGREINYNDILNIFKKGDKK